MFDLSNLRAAETSILEIRHPVTGEPTGWNWTIAGPGHPKTLARQEKIQREQLHEAKLKEQAQVNGRKYKAPEQDPDELRQENADGVACRILDFTPVQLDGAEIRYSHDQVVKLFLDPTFGWLFGQVLEFLVDDAAFFTRSVSSSQTTQSTVSG